MCRLTFEFGTSRIMDFSDLRFNFFLVIYHLAAARALVADGGNGLQICRVATNIYRKHSSREPIRCGHLTSGFGKELTMPTVETNLLRIVHRASVLYGVLEQRKIKKRDLRIRT